MDLQVLNSIALTRNTSLTSIMLGFSEFGDSLLAAIILIIVVSFFVFKIKKLQPALLIAASLAFSQILAHSLKLIIQRERPPLNMAVYEEISYSMPSAHAFLATAFYGMIMIQVGKLIKNKFWRYGFYALMVIIMLGICLSRIYLGVHWTSDVIIGAIMGILLNIALLAYEKRRFAKRS